MPRLQLRLLGGFEARIASGAPLDIANKKTRALLAFLALPAGRSHSRDKLVGLLWSDRGDEQARNSLRQALAELGRQLLRAYPAITPGRIQGHSDIAPGRKTDPGPAFDWQRFLAALCKEST